MSIYMVFSLLLGSCGIVFYYHMCECSEEKIVSLYTDSTEELCHEKVHHSTSNNTCHHSPDERKNCCDSHNSNMFSYRLNDAFLQSDKQATPQLIPLPHLHGGFNCECSALRKQEKQTKINSNFEYGTIKLPISLNFGRMVHICNHSLKLFC